MARMFVLVSLVLSGIGVGGCLTLSFGLGLAACPLCITQRTLIMGLFALTGVGWLAARAQPGVVSALGAGLAFAGLGVAAFHTSLVVRGILECPSGLLGFSSFPAQSLGLFALLCVTTVGGAWAGRTQLSRSPGLATGAGLVIGLLFAWVTVASSPPVPTRTTPYDPVQEPLVNCRPAHVSER